MTFLFAPAHEPRKTAKALASSSPAVILDLEDAVPGDQKAAARDAAARILAEPLSADGPAVWVRINGTDPDFERDLAAIDWSRAAGVVLPKVEDPERVIQAERAGARSVLALIESAAGLGAVERVATQATRVSRLAIGTYDLALDLRLWAIDDPDDSELIWQLRGELVVQSRRFGLPPPIDGICARLSDNAAFERVCRRAAAMGYGGKLLIHPSQIETARSVFTPDPAALASARRLLDAYAAATAEGRGAARFDGRLIDRPMVERARALLEWADGSV